MTGAELVDAVAAAEQAMSAVAAWQMRALSALSVPGVAGDPSALAGRLAGQFSITEPDDGVAGAFMQDAAQSMAAGEVAAVLRISPVTAGVRVRDAIRMCTELPATLNALSAGTIDRGKARVIAEHTAPLAAHLTEKVQQWVLPIAQAQSTAATRKAVAAAVIAVDPRGAEDRHDQARRQRDLTVQPSTDGMSTLKAYLTADGAVGIYQLADLLATHTVGHVDDDRSIGARRVDALTDLAGQILTHGHVDLVDYLAPDGHRDPCNDSAGVFATPAAISTTSAVTASGITAGGLDASRDSGSEGFATAAASAGTPAVMTNGRPNRPGSGCERLATSAGSDLAVRTAAGPAAAPPAARPAGGVDAARATRRLSRQGRRPHLQVTLGMSTLAGLDDLPAHLAGHGAITAGMARSIAASAASLCSLLADDTTGGVLAAGSHTYRPRQDLRDQLAALADSCRFPSCRQPVWRCDIDHRERFDHRTPAAGGRTSVGNTDPLCRRHHLFKHHAGWTLRRDAAGPGDPAGLGVTWISPTGHTYRDPARQVAVPAEWTVHIPDGSARVGLLPTRASATHPEPPTQAARRPPIPELLEHLHLQAGPVQGRHPGEGAGTVDGQVAGRAGAEVSTVEADLASLLLRHHFLGGSAAGGSRPGNRADAHGAGDGGSSTAQPGPGDDPPPF